MAMATWLQGVTDAEIDTLIGDPDAIRRLDNPIDHRTHFGTAINWFLVGNAYPGPDDHPDLWPMLDGANSVACRSLENGAFGVVRPARVPTIAALLAAVDLDDLKKRVAAADFSELVDEEELYDLELVAQDEAPALLQAEVEGLAAFYAAVSKAGLGVVMFTT